MLCCFSAALVCDAVALAFIRVLPRVQVRRLLIKCLGYIFSSFLSLLPENSHELPSWNRLFIIILIIILFFASSFGLSLVIMEVVGEPPFSSSLRRVSSRCLSTFVFSLRGLSRLPSPSGSGWVSVFPFLHLVHHRREGVVSSAPRVRTRRPPSKSPSLSFA